MGVTLKNRIVDTAAVELPHESTDPPSGKRAHSARTPEPGDQADDAKRLRVAESERD